MSQHEGAAPGRRTLKLEKNEIEKAREKINELHRPGKTLKDLSTDELVVLLADASGEILTRGGSDLLPRGVQHRLARMINY